MQVNELVVEKKQIESELESLKHAIKEGYVSKRTVIVRDLMAVYGHLKHGGKIIDLFQTFREHGLNENGHPKLGIVTFNSRYCYLYKKKSGGAIFSNENKDWRAYAKKGIGDIEVPGDTFEWPNLDDGNRWRTVAPIVPPRVITLASAKLTPQSYHILFEVELWAKSKPPPSPPRDPILGKMLTPNIFGVIATWDLTELERTIIKGRLKP